MISKEYMWYVSTFRPVELGPVESQILDIFVNSPQNSTYGVFKIFKEYTNKGEVGPFEHYYPKAVAYKNIHKRVKRLAQLKLIEPVEGHFERGAKYYKTSPQGLITYLGRVETEISDYLHNNMDNIVIRGLLLEFFNDETIDSFRTLKEFPTADIGEYLHDCCSYTLFVCKRFWYKINKFNIGDILPEEAIIQEYMSYLDGKTTEDRVLDEIEDYRKRLRKRLLEMRDSNKLMVVIDTHNSPYLLEGLPVNRNRNSTYVDPPFPLLDLYFSLVSELETALDSKAKALAFGLVSQLGEIVTNQKPIETQEKLEEGLLESGRDYSLYNLLNDKKFIPLVRSIRRDFEYGYKQFLYYHYDDKVTSC
jgi:hypothetical protein